MKTTTVPDQVCGTCGYKMDAASDLEGQRSPKNGDVSICISCAAINIFDAQLKLVKPDDGQLLDLMLSDDWRDIQRAQRAVHKVIGQSTTRMNT